MRKPLIAIALTLLALVLASVWWWRAASPPVTAAPATAPSTPSILLPTAASDIPATATAEPTLAIAAEASTNTAALPKSLQDTAVDGSVELDANGKLRYTAGLRHLFDQALSAIGELSIEQIRVLLSTRLDRLTTADGKRQALAAFERYVRYLQTVDAAAARLSALDLRARLAALVDLRRQSLGGAMADAFFADEEAYQRYTLDGQDLQRDTGLTDAERAARDRELVARLPDSVREPLLAQRRIETDVADAAAIDTLSSDDAERYRLRSQRFGDEAAARMEMLDRERAAWDLRVQAYRAERERLRAAGANDHALADYLSRHFDEAEQRRIRALEGIGEI